MATSNLEKYIQLVKDLLPQGNAWRKIGDTIFSKLAQSVAPEFCRVEDRAEALLNEAFPDSTTELLEDWERVAGLPDECTELGTGLIERRLQLVQKLTTPGGQNAAFYEEIGLQLGFNITVNNILPFQVGRSRVGQAMTNSPIWTHWFQVIAPPTLNVKFKVGINRVGDRLVTLGNTTLECTIQKLKPAHTFVQFIFNGTP